MYRGVLYMLVASASFAVVNIFIKILEDGHDQFPQFQNYPVQELVFFRSIVSLVICMAIIRRRKIPFFGNNKKWLITRGFAGATSLTMFFITLQHLPLAIATTVQYLSPIFTILFAIWLQREKVNPVQWFFIMVSFSGVVVLGFLKSPDSDYDAGWLILGVASAFVSGIAYNAIIKCKDTDEPITIVMYFPLIATPIMLVASIWLGFVMPHGVEWLMLIGAGIMTQIAQFTMTKALHADTTARVTPVKYFGAIYAVIIGFFIFDETLSLYSSLGITLVILGVLLNTLIKKKKPAIQS